MSARPGLGGYQNPGVSGRRNHDWDYFGSDAYSAQRKKCRACGLYAITFGATAGRYWEYQEFEGGPKILRGSVPPCRGSVVLLESPQVVMERGELLDELRDIAKQREAIDRREHRIITALRQGGAGWDLIGAALGLRNRQTMLYRYQALEKRIRQAEEMSDGS